MNLILFVLTLLISFIVVRVGAVALQLTGLEWSVAKFQALSCFSGTGFTTREAELIVGHPRRRQIASMLMVLGNAGLVALIATVANSLRPRIADVQWPLSWLWGGVGPVVNLLLIALAVYATFRFLPNSRLARKLTEYLRLRVKASGIVEPVSFEELMVATGGYGVVRAEVGAGSPLAGKPLSKSGLRGKDITVLAIRRGGEIMANPAAATKIAEGDRLLCFGTLDRMKQEFRRAQPVDRKGGEL